jgi:hypothetical protein
MIKEEAKNLTLSALFIALGLVLPLLTGQLKQLGNAFLNAIPGIIFQLIFIPSLMLALHKTGLVKIYKKNKAKIEV